MVKYAAMKKSISDKLCLFAATGCGLGLITPFAPGTFGSIPGVALAYWLSGFSPVLQTVCALLLVAAAVPLCSRAEKILGVEDDGRIAADEWMLFPVATIGLPLGELPWWMVAIFFAVVRMVDIIKPPPAYALQRVKGGLGVVLDDFAANIYSLAVNWAIYIFVKGAL